MQVKRIAFIGLSLLCCGVSLFAQNIEDARSHLYDQDRRGLHILDSILSNTAKTNSLSLSEAYLLYSEFYYSASVYDSCLIYTDSAIKYYQIIEDSLNIGRMLNRKGIIYDEQGQFAAAMDYYLQSLIVREKIGDELGLSSSFNNLGILNQNLGLYDKSQSYYKEALRIRRNLNDERRIASTLVNLGGVFGEMNMFDSALNCFETALEYYLEVQDSTRIANCYNNIGFIWDEKKQYEKAIDYYLLAKKIKESQNDLRYLASTYINLASSYLNQNSYKQSLYYSEMALKKGKELNMKIDEMDAALLASKATEYLNQKDLSLRYMKMYLELKDEIYNTENLQRIAELQESSSAANAEFRSRERDLEAAILDSNRVVTIWKYLLIVSILVIIFLVYRLQANKNLKINESEELLEEGKTNYQHEIQSRIVQLEKEISSLKKIMDHDDDFLKQIIENFRSESGSLTGLANLASQDQLSEEEKNVLLEKFTILAARINGIVEKLIMIQLINQDGESAEKTDLNELVEGVLSKFKHQIEASGSEINLVFDTQSEIFTKRRMLSFILENVIENALKFSKSESDQSKPSIEIKCRKTLQGGFQIDIKDEGIGIKREILNRVYEPFFRTNLNTYGSGLGLYIVQLASTKIRADIKIESIWTNFTKVSIHINKLEN